MSKLRTVFMLHVAVLMLSTSWAAAQGTATSPSTVHSIDPSTNIAWIGGSNDLINGPAPYPIDLDATGGPWRKSLVAGSDPVGGGGYGGGSLAVRETILNAGTEPWTDWHEIITNGGSHFGTWGSVTDLRINGSSIAFNATISGGGTVLDLDTFSQPVLPGDVLEIDKQFGPLPALFVGPGTTVVSLLNFPRQPFLSQLASCS